MWQRKFLDEAGEIDRLKLIAAKIRKNALETSPRPKQGIRAVLCPYQTS